MRRLTATVLVAAVCASPAIADVDTAFADAAAVIAQNQPAALFASQTLYRLEGCEIGLQVMDVSGAAPGNNSFTFTANAGDLAPAESQKAPLPGPDGQEGIMLLVPTTDMSPSVVETLLMIDTDDANREALTNSGGLCTDNICTLDTPGPFFRIAIMNDNSAATADAVIKTLSDLSAACN